MTIRSAIALFLLSTGIVSAQAPLPQPNQQPIKPVYSPYMNLLNNTRPFYQNYYGTVLPQIQQQNGINNLQQQVVGLQNSAQQNTIGGTGGELATGKQVGFFTHRGYFLNAGGVGTFRTTTGQYSTAGNNSIYQGSGAQTGPAASTGPNGVTSPIVPNSIMPFRR